MKNSPSVRRIGVALAAAAALVLPLSAPAHAASNDAGLYGEADPTYDGVWRQSMALMGLTSNGITPPASAISWLLRQQCADGSFQEYRADVATACPASDPVNFSGPDTNATSVALMALMSLDNGALSIPQATENRIVDAAVAAQKWLAGKQNADGGWPYFPGGASDANSTGLALAGLLTQAPNYSFPAYRKAARFLTTLAAPCSAGGGLAYMAGSKVDGAATAQGAVGLVGPMPVTGPRTLAKTTPCRSSVKDRTLSYLATNLGSTGYLTSAMSPDQADYANTAAGTLALVAAGTGKAAVAKATSTMKTHAKEFVTGKGVNPTAAGLLLMVAEATGSKPTSFGGLNLVTTLASSLRK